MNNILKLPPISNGTLLAEKLFNLLSGHNGITDEEKPRVFESIAKRVAEHEGLHEKWNTHINLVAACLSSPSFMYDERINKYLINTWLPQAEGIDEQAFRFQFDRVVDEEYLLTEFVFTVPQVLRGASIINKQTHLLDAIEKSCPNWRIHSNPLWDNPKYEPMLIGNSYSYTYDVKVKELDLELKGVPKVHEKHAIQLFKSTLNQGDAGATPSVQAMRHIIASGVNMETTFEYSQGKTRTVEEELKIRKLNEENKVVGIWINLLLKANLNPSNKQVDKKITQMPTL